MWTSATDPTTLATISAVMIIAAITASFGPAQRATHLDPAAALRSE